MFRSLWLFLPLFLVSVAFAANPLAKLKPLKPRLAVPQDSLEFFTVDSIVIENMDAFDDSRAHTYYDSTAFKILNVIHVETRKSVIRKMLLFREGDEVNLYNLIESEKILREETYISDASITREELDGKNVLRVRTSDNWTLSPWASLESPGGGELYYGIGIQESNFLGFGQKIAVAYKHDEYRDNVSFNYENTHFILPHRHLDGGYSYASDGYSANARFYLPYLSRSRNQWAYTFAGYSSEADKVYYWSGDAPPGSELVSTDSKWADSLQQLNDDSDPLEVVEQKRLREDSLSLRMGRSFGTSAFKVYATVSYDYHDYGSDFDLDDARRYYFDNDGEVWVLTEDALEDWLPNYKDSRFGFALEISRIRYDRFRNFRNVKWVEDVNRGYSIKAKISKNSEEYGADNNDWRLDYWLSLAFGTRHQHISLGANSYFYFDEEERRDIYEKVSLEYLLKEGERHVTALTGFMDCYKRAPYGKQLTLGGIEGMEGLSSSIFAGQARFYLNLEQRYFADIEIATIMPVFTAFASVGETSESLGKCEPRDLQYIVGFGIRFAATKSINRTVSHLNFSWPVHGPLERSAVPKISLIGKYSL